MNRFDRVFQPNKQAKDQDRVQSPTPATAGDAATTQSMSPYDLDPLFESPEYAVDHALWVALLTEAKFMDLELYGALHCLRCGGATLSRDKDFGMLIRPGEWAAAEYNAFRAKHLAPRKEIVVALLKAAAKVLDELTMTASAETQPASTPPPAMTSPSSPSSPASRVDAIAPRARSLGWTDKDLYAAEPWTYGPGIERQSILWHLAADPKTEIAEVSERQIVLTVDVAGQRWPKTIVKQSIVEAGLFGEPGPAAQHSAT